MIVGGIHGSYRVIHDYIKAQGHSSQAEISKNTGLSIRTIKSAIKSLKQKELISESICLNDIRKREYHYEGDF